MRLVAFRKRLIKLIHSIEGESRIVMEHTGHYYEVLAQQFSAAGLFVSAVNPKLVKTLITILFAKSSPTKLILSRLPATLLTNGKILNHVPAPIRTIHIISIKQSKMQDFRFSIICRISIIFVTSRSFLLIDKYLKNRTRFLLFKF